MTNQDYLVANMIDQEKAAECLIDATEEGLSCCCSAKIYTPDICADCKEHTSPVEENPLSFSSYATTALEVAKGN